MSDQATIFRRLMEVIEQRKAAPSEKSYTNKLLDGGVPKIGGKLTEEAAETVDAAAEPGPAGQEHLAHEAADLIYHLFVLLAHRNVPLDQVETVLAGRFGIGGLEEKASRSKGNEP